MCFGLNGGPFFCEAAASRRIVVRAEDPVQSIDAEPRDSATTTATSTIHPRLTPLVNEILFTVGLSITGTPSLARLCDRAGSTV